MPDAIFLYHCLKNKQLKLNAFSGKDPGGVWLILEYDHRVYSYDMTDNTPMQLKSTTTCCIERRWHILYNPSSARLATAGLLVSNA